MSRMDTIRYTQGMSRSKMLLVGGGIAVVTAAVILGVAIGVPLGQSSGDPALDAARKVLREVPLIDGHNDLPWQFFINDHNDLEKTNLERGLLGQWNITHTDIPRIREGMLGAQFWVVYASCSTQYRDAVRQCFEQADVIRRFINKYDQTFRLVTDAEGIEKAFKDGKVGSLMGMEGGHCIDSSLATLRMFYQLGVRYMTLTHNCNTPWADNNVCDAVKDPHDCGNVGLTDFGRIVVKEMNRIGMFVDLSHGSHRQMEVVLDVTRAPVIFSHSSAYSLCNHHRNVRDDILRRMAANGGVVMVTFVPSFVTCPPGYQDEATSNISHVADHIEHVREEAGIDYVGIGSDYDGIPTTPIGLEDVSKFPALFAELVKRGWTEEELKKLAGENLLRAMRKMEEVRDQLVDEKPDATILNESKLNMTCRSAFPNSLIP